MKLLKGEIVYHIQTKQTWKKQWSIGEIYEIGEDYNPFYLRHQEIGKFIPVDGKNLSVDYAADSWLRMHRSGECEFKGISQISALDMIDTLNDTLRHYLRYTREVVFEEVRQEVNVQLPSRQKGIWLLPDNDPSFWIGKLNLKSRLLKLKVTGKVHRGSENLLWIRTDPLNDIRGFAKKYWAGVDLESKQDELLFEGSVEVLDISDIN
jgi:hypothetical protein